MCVIIPLCWFQEPLGPPRYPISGDAKVIFTYWHTFLHITICSLPLALNNINFSMPEKKKKTNEGAIYTDSWLYCLESNDRQTTTKILCIWQTQSSFKHFQSVIGNSVKNWQMWIANCIRFVLVILNVCIRAAFHIVGKLWSSHFWIRVYLLSATCISTTLVLWHLLFHFLFFFFCPNFSSVFGGWP